MNNAVYRITHWWSRNAMRCCYCLTVETPMGLCYGMFKLFALLCLFTLVVFGVTYYLEETIRAKVADGMNTMIVNFKNNTGI